MVEGLCLNFFIIGRIIKTLWKFAIEYEYMPQLHHKSYPFCVSTLPLLCVTANIAGICLDQWFLNLAVYQNDLGVGLKSDSWAFSTGDSLSLGWSSESCHFKELFTSVSALAGLGPRIKKTTQEHGLQAGICILTCRCIWVTCIVFSFLFLFIAKYAL